MIKSHSEIYCLCVTSVCFKIMLYLGSVNLETYQILINEPMSKHTSFRVGGICDKMLLPTSIDEIISAIQNCRKNNEKFFVMGNGSNLLVSDEGFRGTIIKISKQFSTVELRSQTEVYANAGILLSTLANFLLKHNLTGAEFVSGIPGTLGGALFMNAGAYGSELKDIVTSVTALTDKNEIKVIPNEQCEFAYRSSKMQRDKTIILGASLTLSLSEYNLIKEQMQHLNKMRAEKQPLNYGSAGSTFKRPEGRFAGKLIQDAGLSGYTIGEAAVSEKHCGFIINKGNASANDILALIHYVQKTVLEKFNIELHPEVQILD